MTITREQVADLRVGDVVELHESRWGGVTIAGPVREVSNSLCVGPLVIGYLDTEEPFEPYDPDTGRVERTLTVISRAPRPLYVNHDRTEPVPGDVVRDADRDLWLLDGFKTWQGTTSTCGLEHQETGLIPPLTLLVDGTTGEVVP